MTPRLLSAALLLSIPAFAQLPAPNAAGVSAGHDVLRAKDIAAANKFWQDLGGEPVQFAGRLNLIKFPGLLILEVGAGNNQGKNKQEPPLPAPELLGTEGSSLDFISFSVKDLKASLAKWDAAGIKPLPGATAAQAYLLTPDKIKVRITEDKSQSAPIVSDKIKMMVPDVKAAQEWYATNLGAKLVQRGGETVADLPGHSIIFEQAKGPVAPTKGRAYDRIGIEAVDGDALYKKLEANGVKFDSPFRYTEAMKAGFAVFQDPWGTLIEISQGLNAVK